MPVSASDLEIVRAGAERLDELRPLWESMSTHHAGVAPQLERIGAVRTPAESWAVRRRLYADWLAEPGAFVLLAQRGGRAVGYALVHMREAEESWDTGPVATLESLAVLPGERGAGVGGMLFDRMHAELRAVGVRTYDVAAIATNEGARRFYESRGAVPFLVAYLGSVR
jgi:GNAT superfamily N-acetyltransferase